jgi:16S rRNA (adenine1518-N6/adenine1519-N6)-dimethyltransferase
MHRPRKRFGQHFLHAPDVIARILRAISPQPGQHLLEIGPGRGALTGPLLESGADLELVELDRDLIPGLEAFAARSEGRLRVHQADALEFDVCALARDAKLRVVGNLPYNISTPLIFRLLDQRRCIEDMHFMLQKEVVDRMAAAPGGKDYGRLSVMVQFHCEVLRLFTIGPGAFRPPPKVDSAFVRLAPHARPPVEVADPKAFGDIVRLAFMYRRKTLRNALSALLDSDAISAAGVDPGLRAEQLGLDAFARLADQVMRETDLN